MSCTLLFSATTIDHAVTQQRHAGLSGELAITSTGPGLPAATLADARATPGVRSAVALTPTTLGPSLGVSDDTIPAADPQRRAGRRARRRRDRRVARRRCTATRSRSGAGAPTARTPRSATAWRSCSATGPARTPRSWRSTPARWGSATPCSPPSSRPATRPARCSGRSSSRPATRPPSRRRLRALAARYPGLRVSDRASVATATDADRETNRWLGPLFVAIIFAFTSIAVVNTLMMIALQRGRELGLLRLVGGTPGQVRSMARWEAGLIITIGLGLGLAIAATALLPLSHALTGNLRPVRAARPARGDPRRLSAAGAARPGAARRGGRCARGRSRRSEWGSNPRRRRRVVAALRAAPPAGGGGLVRANHGAVRGERTQDAMPARGGPMRTAGAPAD